MSTAEHNVAGTHDAHIAPHHEHAGAHVVPGWLLIGVYLILMVLTAITVFVSTMDLGQYNIIVALGVAVIKASLVALFFMHLFWDSKFNSVVLIAALIFVSLFIGLALLDSTAYQPVIKVTPVAKVP